MPYGGRFSIRLVCMNPACTTKAFDLPEDLMPDDWFQSYDDAVDFICALQSGALPSPMSTLKSTRLSRALHAVAAQSNRLDFRDDVVSCDCGYSCHLSDFGFLVMRIA
jgi:hypothetical protein